MTAVELVQIFTIERPFGREQQTWALVGPDGAAVFKAGPADQIIAQRMTGAYVWIQGLAWIGWFLGTHRLTQPYAQMGEAECAYLDGRPCSIDGDSATAEALLTVWGAADCDEAMIWARLADLYDRRLGR